MEFFEAKAVGRSRTAFVYAGRLEKDRRFCASNSLTYIIWHHVADTQIAKTVRELEELVLGCVRAVYVVPFARLDELCMMKKLEPLNSRYGRHSAGDTYGSGYRIRLGELEEFCQLRLVCYVL